MDEEDKRMISLDEWYSDVALEIDLIDDQSFLKIKETLTRIGVSSNKDNKIFQSCHIFSKRDKYYIVHFKELFALDGRYVNLSKDDIGRRNTIACLIEEWGMIKIKDHEFVNSVRLPVTSFKIIKYAEKNEYELIAKYQIGNKQRG